MTDATWIGSVNNDYNNAANWDPATVPTRAIFAGTYTIALSQNTGVNTWFVDAGDVHIQSGDIANAFGLNYAIQFLGLGIAISDGSLKYSMSQSQSATFFVFSTAGSAQFEGGSIAFAQFSNAGNAIIKVDSVAFHDFSSASNATIETRNSLTFVGDSTAANATIVSYGSTTFSGNASAGAATITNYLGSINDSNKLVFSNVGGAGSSTINNYALVEFNGGDGGANATINNHSGGEIRFLSASTAGSATITTEGGASVIFFDSSDGGNDAKFITKLGGLVNFAGTVGPANSVGVGSHQISAGSIEGAGTYALGQNELTVGDNNSSMIVSGSITGAGGSLAKTGTGTLKLSGANTFDAGITLNEGTLDFASLTAAGTGHVNFDIGAQTLIIEKSALAAKTFANEIHDFGIGDAIELSGLKFVKGETKVTYNALTDLLTVKSGKVIDKLTLVDPDTNFFKIVNDGGHVNVIITATAARHHHRHNAKVADHDDGGVDFWRGQFDGHHSHELAGFDFI